MEFVNCISGVGIVGGGTFCMFFYQCDLERQA